MKNREEVTKVWQEEASEFITLTTESGTYSAGTGLVKIHNSPRRGENFVTYKVVQGAVRIKLGLRNNLTLGNLSARRDWGHSKDYMRAIIKILEHDEPDDFAVATGEYYSVEEFVNKVFDKLDLDPKHYIKFDDKYTRPKEVPSLLGDPEKIKRVLGWEPEISVDDLIDEMIEVITEKEKKNAQLR